MRRLAVTVTVFSWYRAITGEHATYQCGFDCKLRADRCSAISSAESWHALDSVLPAGHFARRTCARVLLRCCAGHAKFSVCQVMAEGDASDCRFRRSLGFERIPCRQPPKVRAEPSSWGGRNPKSQTSRALGGNEGGLPAGVELIRMGSTK